VTAKRGYSREFPIGDDLTRRRKLEIDWVPPWLFRAARQKAKREGISLRVIILRWLTAWVK
jgi:hypothetical protein